MASEVTIGDKTFVTGKLHVFDQFHVFRRVTPVMQPVLMVFRAAGGKLNFADMFMAIAGPLGSLPNEDMDFVRDKCLSVVKYRDPAHGDRLFPLMTGSTLMYHDLDVLTMLRLIWEVLMDDENLGPFIKGLIVGLAKKDDPGATAEPAAPPTT